MLINERNYPTVFMLGAGATRGALSHVILNGKRIRPPLNGDFFKVAETYSRAKGKKSADVKRVSKLLRVFKNEIPIKGKPTMEEAFSLLYIAKDFPEIYKGGPGRKRKAGVHKEVKDFLQLTFSILAIIDRKSPNETGYDRLARKLGPTDTVITLNYDTVFDSALSRHGWDPKTGYALGGGNRKVAWRPERVDGSINIAGVRLLKLHGSTNWYVRGSYSKPSKVFTSKPVLVSGPRQNEIRGYIRQIVPPIYGKIFEHDHWRNLWTQAYKRLCEAKILVVIGCSLIDTDFHLRALLSRVVRNRKTRGSPLKRAIFVAGTKTRRKWQRSMRGSYKEMTGYPNFEQFLRKELHE
jgi:hypothetical protein